MLALSTSNLLGKNVIVTIKPENIRLLKSVEVKSQSAEVNCIDGVVTEMIKMRSNAQVTVDVGV